MVQLNVYVLKYIYLSTFNNCHSSQSNSCGNCQSTQSTFCPNLPTTITAQIDSWVMNCLAVAGLPIYYIRLSDRRNTVGWYILIVWMLINCEWKLDWKWLIIWLFLKCTPCSNSEQPQSKTNATKSWANFFYFIVIVAIGNYYHLHLF